MIDIPIEGPSDDQREGCETHVVKGDVKGFETSGPTEPIDESKNKLWKCK